MKEFKQKYSIYQYCLILLAILFAFVGVFSLIKESKEVKASEDETTYQSLIEWTNYEYSGDWQEDIWYNLETYYDNGVDFREIPYLVDYDESFVRVSALNDLSKCVSYELCDDGGYLIFQVDWEHPVIALTVEFVGDGDMPYYWGEQNEVTYFIYNRNLETEFIKVDRSLFSGNVCVTGISNLYLNSYDIGVPVIGGDYTLANLVALDLTNIRYNDSLISIHELGVGINGKEELPSDQNNLIYVQNDEEGGEGSSGGSSDEGSSGEEGGEGIELAEKVSLFDGAIDLESLGAEGTKTINGVTFEWTGLNSETSYPIDVENVNGKHYLNVWRTGGKSSNTRYIRVDVPEDYKSFNIYVVASSNGSSSVDVGFADEPLFNTGSDNLVYSYATSSDYAPGSYCLTFSNSTRLAEVTLKLTCEDEKEKEEEPDKKEDIDINFYKDFGEDVYYTITLGKDELVLPNAPLKQYYDCIGWKSYQVDGFDDVVIDSTNFEDFANSLDKDTNLYAVWEEHILLIFIYFDGTESISTTFDLTESPLTEFPFEPVREGFEFVGWKYFNEDNAYIDFTADMLGSVTEKTQVFGDFKLIEQPEGEEPEQPEGEEPEEPEDDKPNEDDKEHNDDGVLGDGTCSHDIDWLKLKCKKCGMSIWEIIWLGIKSFLTKIKAWLIALGVILIATFVVLGVVKAVRG